MKCNQELNDATSSVYRILIDRRLFMFACILCLVGCQSQKNQWEIYYPKICSFSSPRPIDINQDGILDFVLGVGKEELMPSDTGIIALDGRNGEMIWFSPSKDQIVGSPLFIHINGDSVPDIVIGGRDGELRALNGKNGQVLWRYFDENDYETRGDTAFLNFYNSQIVGDVNQDEVPDLLISYGGLASIPYYEPNRPAGKLMLLNSHTGKALAEAVTPDSQETFMSPLCVDLDQDGNKELLFGTGGETYKGNFYIAKLEDLIAGDLSNAVCLIEGKRRGFIAPPIVAHLNRDQVQDIVVNAVEGRVVALDGFTFDEIWSVDIPHTEVYSSMAMGQFTGDETPDIFTNFGVGIFPKIEKAIQLLIDGSNGAVVLRDTLGYLQISSPLAADVDMDGTDEVFISINNHMDSSPEDYYNTLFGVSTQLVMINFNESSYYRLIGPLKGINPASTPWIGDIDKDQKMDVIYPYMCDTVSYIPFNGMKIIRKELPFPTKKLVWSSYMGSRYNGIYP